MNTKEIIKQNKEILRTIGKYKTNKVAVEINGKLMYMAEYEIRALQVFAKKQAEISEEAFKNFCNSVIVYSGRYKRTSKHTMHFREDGCFSDEFEDGFYNVNTNLLYELL